MRCKPFDRFDDMRWSSLLFSALSALGVQASRTSIHLHPSAKHAHHQSVEIEQLCSQFSVVRDFVVDNCDVEFNQLSAKCIVSLMEYDTDQHILQKCMKNYSSSAGAKTEIEQFQTIYERWQQGMMCSKHYENEERAVEGCTGYNLRYSTKDGELPAYCSEIFLSYNASRHEIERQCQRTSNTDAFWEGFAEFIATPTCKQYYDNVRAANEEACDIKVDYEESGSSTGHCHAMFVWYEEHKPKVEAIAMAHVHHSMCLRCLRAEFVYYDFNGTTGLVLNGNAATTSCTALPRNAYSEKAGKDDVREASIEIVHHQLAEQVVIETSNTENHTTSGRIAVETATHGHRDNFEKSEEQRCAVRLRLTPSQPRQVSSVWFSESLPVVKGFETRFTFQITDQSKRCFHVKDENFGVRAHRSCMVHGGDGFAFVLHSHANKTDTVGVNDPNTRVRSQMGYEGLDNSLAIEFDTWYNTEYPDSFYDHVGIYSRGVAANTMLDDARLSAIALHDLADGRIHVVKIRYYNEIKYEYAPYFSATAKTVDFIKDISEGRRMGTLLVFMDDGIASDTPLVAIPINLAAALRLNSDEAYVVSNENEDLLGDSTDDCGTQGFTASTGKSWQKHDILGWYYCTQPPCLDEYGDTMTFDFDYNQQSMLSTASHKHNIYPIYIYPDTTPWTRPQHYFADGQQVGIVS
ncbi:TPA: hypothetical protein N0F65_001654 [Lagenidium giganteum]|uniref:Legume lectin domain-containing protein n=1 Tax=Lagenidium giganteum TaxID=4803 RepID=A0AAV2Z1I5_9STRA|nr:TPA: hypothetical protein N0F65_001654 [Lagenidium giganteum]